MTISRKAGKQGKYAKEVQEGQCFSLLRFGKFRTYGP